MAKIIIADNNETNTSFIKRSLTVKNHQLIFFTNASALIGELDKKEYDIIVLGVQLDEGDGRDLSKKLHMETRHKDIPVILTSPFYHTENEIRSFYCDDLLSMPYDSARLVASVEALLVREEAKANKKSKSSCNECL